MTPLPVVGEDDAWKQVSAGAGGLHTPQMARLRQVSAAERRKAVEAHGESCAFNSE